MKAAVHPANRWYALELAPKLREEDVAEIRAASGYDAACALLAGVEAGRSWAACDDKGVFMLFGVAPSYDPLVGACWMSASPRMLQHKKQFVRDCRGWVNEMHRDYPALFNFADARNKVHLRWLQWCGFTIINRHEQYGVERRPFYEFIKVKNV